MRFRANGEGPGIDQPDEIRPRTDPRERIARLAVLLVESWNRTAAGAAQLRACGESHDADLVRIDVPFLGVGAHDADGLHARR